MPSSSIAFPSPLVKSLEFLREHVLGLTQQEIAHSAQIAQGTYSNLVLGKPVRGRSARAIVAAIQQATEHYIRRTNRTPDEAAEILRPIAWAITLVEGRPEMDAADTTNGERALDLRIIDRFAQRTSPRPATVHPPGGAVPSDAFPYVQRKHDALILQTLQLPEFTMLVRGPSQCGKSTALALLERRALEVGIETASFEPQPQLAGNGHEPTNADADANAAHAICELLQARWNLSRPRQPVETIAKLFNWLIRELKPTASKPRLLILDDLVALGGGAADRWLSLFVRALVNQRATDRVNISVAVGLTDHFGPSFTRKLMLISSVVYWQPSIVLGWLDEHELTTMWQRLRGNHLTDLQDDSMLGQLHAALRGQPYLTHAALIDPVFRNSVLEWTARHTPDCAAAIRQTRWYRRHLRRIKVSLCGPTMKPDAEAKRLIASFHEKCRSESFTRHRQIDSDHGLFFATAHLLDQLHNPAIEMYRLIAEDLQEGH